MTLAERINKLPKWARDYVHRVHTFIGAPEVQELTQLRDERRQLIKQIAELRSDNRGHFSTGQILHPKGTDAHGEAERATEPLRCAGRAVVFRWGSSNSRVARGK